jgi:hypothetical protein
LKRIAITLLLCAIAGTALAQTDTCKSRADDKKLAGAALTSFMKKCKKDAMKSCDATAIDKSLSGAARTSFTKKCVNDAVGS